MRVSLFHRQWMTGLALLAQGEAAASDIDAVLFDSLDASAAVFSSAGAKVGLGSLDRTGPLALVGIGDGVHTEQRRCGCGVRYTFMRLSAEASVQVGHQWTLPQGVVAGFGGFETTHDQQRGTRQGLRVQAEAWLRPDDDTLVQATLIAGTARGSGWTRISWGYRLWHTYIGPEGSAYLEAAGYRKGAFGVHATDFVLMDIHVRVSTGMQWETGRARPAPYVTLTTWSPF